uniref:Zn(2)-C6 fungal-type domain-containing protein n=1 Tax=Bionectria ochroleuca TaxID=29856 RepID=A0A8H7NP73_BIOOC
MMMRTTRSSTACARCYRRKKKCDGNYPTCSHCERAKVQCVGLDRGSEIEVPRSLVYYLEELVAQLELERGRLTRNRPVPEGTISQCNDIQPDSSLFSVETESEDHFKIAYKLAAITAKESAPACSLRNRPRHVLPYHKAFFMNAELPFPLAFGSHRTIDVPNSSNGSSFTQLPDEVADKLMAVYLNRISSQYPIFSREDVNDIFQRFKLPSSDPQMVTPDERFVIWIIMAIAVLSSTADDYRKLASVAESLRRNAFNHFDLGLRTNHGTTTTIRQLLLLLQYGFLLPSSTNLWQVAGDAMRIAVGLGLHQDTPAESGFDEETVQSRKKLFWTLYAFERSIAITSHRPYAIAGDQIHTSFLVSQDVPDTPDETAGKTPYIGFFDRVEFLRIQSEICSVNIGMRPLPNSHLTHEAWIADTERRVSDAMAHAVNPDWCMFMCRHATLLLHMPCARNPTPCDRSILKYFDAAICTARAYWDLIESNNLDCAWHATHHCYEAGNLILYSLWHFRDLIKRHFTTNQIFEVVHQISGFFILVATRWAAAQHCGSLFDRLRTGALSFFRDETTSDPEQSLEARQLRELVFRENADLLYAREQPSPSAIGPSAFPTAFPEFEIDQLCIENNTDILNFLHLSDDVPVFDESCPEDIEMDVGHFDIPLAHQSPSLDESSEPKKLMIDESQYRAVLQKIPVCSHCKKRRIKCDIQLPSCANCTKLNRECCYWDRASGEEASRNHLHALKLHAENLMTDIKELQRPQFVSDAPRAAYVLGTLAMAQPKTATNQPSYPNIFIQGIVGCSS